MLLLLVSLAAVELVAAPTWRAYRGNDETMAALREQLERYQRIAATRPATERLLARLAEHRQREGLTLDEPNAGRAAAALQESVTSLVDAGGGRLLSTRMLPAQADGSFYRVVAQVRLQADTESLGPVLYGLESHFPYLFLDELTVIGRGVRVTRQGGETPTIPLDVSLEVAAYLPADRVVAEADR